MELRTILAIIIIGIIILLTPLYQRWLYKRSSPEFKAKPSEMVQDTSATDTVATEVLSPPVSVSERIEGRSIVVETPL
ncbi:MAG: hypothetical protein DRP95_03185, partial [Candidatus Latescibacterota bacterium]